MGRINNYPLDKKITINDRLIGSDAENGGQTQNYALKDILNFIKEEVDVLGVDGVWVYSCEGDSYEYGNFYTPGVCFTGNDDPGFPDINEILISNKTIRNIEAGRYLKLAGSAGVMLALYNQNDLSNFLIIKNPTFEPQTQDFQGYLKLTFSDIYTSKSFKQGDEYSLKILGSSPAIFDLYKEKRSVLSNTTTPSTNDGVHIGQNDVVKVYKDKVEISHNIFKLTGDVFIDPEATDRETDPEALRTFRLLSINNQGRVYPLYFGDVQADWTDNDESSRYHIKNRFAQKDINTNYTLQPSDNGKTLFVNNGSGDITISINRNNSGMDLFRQCRIIQLGSGNVIVAQATGGPQYVVSKVAGNRIGGAVMEAMLIRQASDEDGVITLGNFYLFNAQSTGNDWAQESI